MGKPEDARRPLPAVRVLVLLLASIWLPLAAGQGGLDVTILDQHFDVGPETWKHAPLNDLASWDGTEDLQAIGPWGASLGQSLDLGLRVQRGGQTAPTTWDFHVTLSDGSTILEGLVQSVAAGRIDVRFDVDGQRALPGQAAIQPLAPGTWTVTVSAAQGERHEGRGSAVLMSQSLTFRSMRADGEPAPGLALPESLLPHIDEVGPGPNTWMPMQAVQRSFTVTLDAPPGNVTWMAWVAAAGIDTPTPAGFLAVPLPALPAPSTGLVTWFHSDAVEIPTVRGQNIFGAVVPGDPQLLILTAHHPDGGFMSIAVPTSAETPPALTEILASAPGSEGPVAVTASAPVGSVLAPLHVLSQDVAGTDGTQRGARLLTTGALVPAGEYVWRGGYDGQATRAAQVPHVAILAWFQDAQGHYAGHVAGLRGMSVQWAAPTLGQGHEGHLQITYQHAHPSSQEPALSLPALATLRFAGQELQQDAFELAAGGRITREVPITPSLAGSHAATVRVDTGDLYFEAARSFDVLEPAAYDDATAPWYDVPSAPIVGLLVGLFGLARQRGRI